MRYDTVTSDRPAVSASARFRPWTALSAAAATAALVGLAAPSAAQGFALHEIGSCAVGRASAGVAAPCGDASVLFWNPALASRLPGRQVSVGISAIRPSASYRADATIPARDPGPAGARSRGLTPRGYPPYGFANLRVLPRIGVGIGVYVPYGRTTQWGDDFAGRFVALRSRINSVYVQPNVALDVLPGRLAIGGGPVLARSTFELEQGIDLAASGAAFPRGTEFARSSVVATGVASGYHVGAHLSLASKLALGVRYLSRIDFEYTGDVVFRQVATGVTLPADNPYGAPAGTALDEVLAPQFASGGRYDAQRVRAGIPHPAQLQAGIAFGGTGRNLLMADYAWYGWAAFRELPMDFDSSAFDRAPVQDYEDSHAVRLAYERRSLRGLTARAGIGFVKSPAPDVTVTPLLPDQDRLDFGVGITRLMGEGFLLDLSYLRMQGAGRRGRVIERADRSEGAEGINGGRYELAADVVSLGFKVLFP